MTLIEDVLLQIGIEQFPGKTEEKCSIKLGIKGNSFLSTPFNSRP